MHYVRDVTLRKTAALQKAKGKKPLIKQLEKKFMPTEAQIAKEIEKRKTIKLKDRVDETEKLAKSNSTMIIVPPQKATIV